MVKDPASQLRQKFLRFVEKKWLLNDHDLKEIPCVYIMMAYEYGSSHRDIVYVGSTTKLYSRYICHNIPGKIQSMGLVNLMYFLPMNKGFYDYEIKLIKKLQPIFNIRHK